MIIIIIIIIKIIIIIIIIMIMIIIIIIKSLHQEINESSFPSPVMLLLIFSIKNRSAMSHLTISHSLIKFFYFPEHVGIHVYDIQQYCIAR